MGKPHGIRGEVRLRLAEGSGQSLDVGSRVRLSGGEDGPVFMEIVSLRGRGTGSPIIGFKGISDRDMAAQLTNRILEIAASSLPPLAENEFYYHEVIGARLLSKDGRQLGEVIDVIEGGGRFYLVCHCDQREMFLPVTGKTLLEIRADKGEVVVDPSALIDPEAPDVAGE